MPEKTKHTPEQTPEKILSLNEVLNEGIIVPREPLQEGIEITIIRVEQQTSPKYGEFWNITAREGEYYTFSSVICRQINQLADKIADESGMFKYPVKTKVIKRISFSGRHYLTLS